MRGDFFPAGRAVRRFAVSFFEILKDTVDGVDGAVAAVLMGTDGIAVDHYVRPGSDCDIEAVAVEFGRVVEEVKKAADLLDFGKVREIFFVGSEDGGIVIRPVSADYYLVVLLKRGANTAKARYLLRKAALRTGKEF